MQIKVIWKWIKRLFKGPGTDHIRPANWPTSEQIMLLPWFDGLNLDAIRIVATPEHARRAYEELSKTPVVGFDTESKPTFKKGEVSHGPHIVQFSTLEHATIFMLHEPHCRRIAGELVALGSLKKVGFGLSHDLKQLRSKLHVHPQNVFDVERLCRAKGYGRGMGVKVAVAMVLGRRFRKSRRASTSNWAARYLTDQQILYAANDAFAAIKVYEALLSH